MNRFSIEENESLNWAVFLKESIDPPIQIEIVHVLRAVKRVFEGIFGADVVNSRSSLRVVYIGEVEDEPQVYREDGIIFLTPTSFYYPQHVYQFAHELCHFMSPHRTCDSFRWFDETLCKLMSIYVLTCIKAEANTNPIDVFVPYYALLDRYIADATHVCDLSGEPFPQYFRSRLPYLRSNWYDRALNTTIACQIAPLFFEHPVLWRLVLKLHLLDANMSLDSALRFLGREAGVSENLVERLISCFFE